MKIKYYSLTDKGVSRDHNEDTFLNNEKFSVFMVADGMGGYECGDLASKMALDSVVSYLEKFTKNDGIFSERTYKLGVEYANSCIMNHKKKNPEIKNMGTTFVSFVYSRESGLAFHVGDSRLYRFRNNNLEQITKDHSAEQEVLPEFMQNADDGKFSSVITRALGTDEKVNVDSTSFDYLNNDLILLCSDGLYSMVNDDQIKEIISSTDSLKIKCTNLIDKANENGGEDNITAILLQIESIDNPDVVELEIVS